MKTLRFLLILIVVCCAKAWPNVRRSQPTDLLTPNNVHTVTECMHINSEEGIYTFRKTLRKQPQLHDRIHFVGTSDESEPAVCGIYLMTDPDKVIEVEVEFSDVSCELGGLLGFVDGWELNGEYFPGIHDHELSLDNRVSEFCDRSTQSVFKRRASRKRRFISHQNAALFQYKIPYRGSFVISVKFHHNPKPCNVMVEATDSFYTLSNHGTERNCTLMAAFPAVVTIEGIKVGGNTENVNYDCDQPSIHDKLHVGGTTGLDGYHLTKGTSVCGRSEVKGPEQTVLCGTTNIRLESSGQFDNKVVISMRPADLENEDDLALVTAVCDV